MKLVWYVSLMKNHFYFHKEYLDRLGTPWHITNNDAGIYDIIEIDETVQGNSDNMKAAKKEKATFESKKMMVVKLNTLYGLLNIVRKQEQTLLLWHVNFHKEQRWAVIASKM